jgi:PPOX class probable F420-dependent enzyme
MDLSAHDREFLSHNHSAAMITIAKDGTPRVARVGVDLVDGSVWSSGTADRVRTKRLRRDPRCTLYVYDRAAAWLALEATVTILDGPEAPEQNLRLFRRMQGKPNGPLTWFGRELDDDAFRRAMVDEQRVIYEFDVHRAYGMR